MGVKRVVANGDFAAMIAPLTKFCWLEADVMPGVARSDRTFEPEESG